MIKIAIIGGIASGKSTALQYIGDVLGDKVTCINCDDLNRILLSDAEYIKTIGENFDVVRNGSIDKKLLSKIIFNSEIERKKLNNIAHPQIKNLMIKSINSAKTKFIFIEIPLIEEFNVNEFFDDIWLIDCPKNMQLDRLMKRNNYTLDEAKARISSQTSNEKLKLIATKVIDSQDNLLENIKTALEKYD